MCVSKKKPRISSRGNPRVTSPFLRCASAHCVHNWTRGAPRCAHIRSRQDCVYDGTFMYSHNTHYSLYHFPVRTDTHTHRQREVQVRVRNVQYGYPHTALCVLASFGWWWLLSAHRADVMCCFLLVARLYLFDVCVVCFFICTPSVACMELSVCVCVRAP